MSHLPCNNGIKEGVAGGMLLSILAWSGQWMQTACTAALGAAVSFGTSMLLRFLFHKIRKLP